MICISVNVNFCDGANSIYKRGAKNLIRIFI